MNKKDILTDFCIHLLLLGDEFRNNELQFFDNNDKNETTYEKYVIATNKFIDVESFLWETDLKLPISKTKALKDLITEKEIDFLQSYIEEEFIFGYPNEINEDGFTWGETHRLNITIDEIKYQFTIHNELRNYNSKIYVTYFQQFLDHLSNQRKKNLGITKEYIDNFYKNKNSIPIETYSKLKDKLESQLQEKLLKSTQKAFFQIQGGFDELGFILNYKETLKTILISSNSKPNLSIDLNHYYTLVEYEYYQFKILEKKIFHKSNEEKKLEKEFESLKEENSKQIQFLKNKGFSNSEITIIFNCFSLNKYSSLNNIRSIYEPSKIDFYRIFHLFYRFEFLAKENNIKFDEEKTFDIVPLTQKKGAIDKNQYYKYHKHSTDPFTLKYNTHRDYPFNLTKTKKLLEKIELELLIDLNKLNIPSHFKKHLKKT